MSDDDLRQVFARLGGPAVQPRPEFVEQLMAGIDALIDTGGPAAELGTAAQPRGEDAEDTYLIDREEQPVVSPQPRKISITVGLAAAATVIALVAVLMAWPNRSHQQNQVAIQPAITQRFINDLHGPYQSYHLAVSDALTACLVSSPVNLSNCRGKAEVAVAAANQLLAVVSQAQAPAPLVSASQQLRAALNDVITYLNATIAATTANDTVAVKAAAGNFAGADGELCGPVSQLNHFAPIDRQFTNTTSEACNS